MDAPTDTAPGHVAHDGAPWTADQVAEDLLAQLDELFAEGFGPTPLAAALEAEGLSEQTAADLVERVAGGRPGSQHADDVRCGIDLVQLRRFLRPVGRRLGVDDARAAELNAAFGRQGLPPGLAAAVVAEVASTQQRFADLQARRMRRLGLQGMVAGLLFSAFFAWTAVVAGPAGKWNLLTAAFTLALAGYSALLWRRHR